MFKGTTGQFARLNVGVPDFTKGSLAAASIGGILTNPGITVFGTPPKGPFFTSTVTMGPAIGIPTLTLPNTLEVNGIAVFFGITKQLGAYVCSGASKFDGAHVVNGVDAHNGATTITGPFVAMSATINPQAWKGFDIKHPNKKNHRLRHICVEGPEAAVYVRGRLKDGNEIKLPEYWDGLVDYDSITVQLQPIGDRHFHLNISEIDKEKVVVKESDDKPFECFYHIWASRIDGEPLVVEYEGETPADYPSDSEQFSISGFDYGRDVE